METNPYVGNSAAIDINGGDNNNNYQIGNGFGQNQKQGTMTNEKVPKLPMIKPSSFRKSSEGNGMYDGPRFHGEARIPIEKELELLAIRIKKQKNCKALIMYLFFIAVYVGILCSYPIKNEGRMTTEISDWLKSRTWGDQKGLKDVATDSDFWQWFEEVVVNGVWLDEDVSTVLNFNSLLTGVTLWQRRTNISTSCNGMEKNFFDFCPHWPTPENYLPVPADQEYYQNVLPSRSSLEEADRRGFFAEVFPVTTQTEEGDYQVVSKATTKQHMETLKAGNWIDDGTDEVMTVMIFYNANTKLYITLQIRFLWQETGGIDYDVISGAITLNPLNDEIEDAGGAPWRIRVTFEIIFALNVVIMLTYELAEFAVSIKTEVKEAQLLGLRVLKGFMIGLKRYLYNFWNFVDALMISLSISIIVLQIQWYYDLANVRYYITQNADLETIDDKYLTAYFINLTFAKDTLQVVNTLCQLVVFFRLFKFLEFHSHLGIVSRTIAAALPTCVNFGVVLTLVVFGYALIGWIMFSPRSVNFTTFTSTLGSIIHMLLVGMDWEGFLELIQTQHYDWWAWTTLFVYYVGFIVVCVMLMLNIFLGIILASYQEFHCGPKRKLGALDQSLYADFHMFWFQVKRTFGCVKAKPKRSKVDPLSAYLTPKDAELVRPGLERIYNELTTVYAIFNDAQNVDLNKPNAQIVPFRNVERHPSLVVTFNFSDVAQIFTDPVGLYLWALYGPGAPIEDMGYESTQAPRDAKSVMQQQLMDNQAKLEEKVNSLDHKLDIIIAALANPAMMFPSGLDSARLAQDLKTTARTLKEEVAETETQTMDPIVIDKTQAGAEVLPSPQSPLQEAKLAEAEQLIETKEPDDNLDDDSEEEEGEEEDEEEEEERSAVQGNALINIMAEDQQRENGPVVALTSEAQFELLINDLLASGPCPLQRIKDACAEASPGIPWEVAKSVRREMGILQYKALVATDGNSATRQLVRFWRKATPTELERMTKVKSK